MIVIYINAEGTAQKVSPSHIYQGSNQSSVTVFAPVPTTTALSIAFKLPDGTRTVYYPMTFIQSAEGLSQYEFTLNSSITQKAGQSAIAISMLYSDGRQTSQLIDFDIEPSILPEPPSDIDENAYEIIKQYLQKDRSDITALQGQMNSIEETAENAEKAATNAVETANEAKTTADGLADSIAQANDTSDKALAKATTVEGQQKLLRQDYAFWKENTIDDQKAFENYIEQQTKEFNEYLSNTLNEGLGQFQNEAADLRKDVTQFKSDVSKDVAEAVNTANGYAESIAQANTKADEAVKNSEEAVKDITRITDVIPSSATAENQLADKAFVNSTVNSMAAFYITYNAVGDKAFPTRADLLNATVFYSGGKERVPTQNDYAVVLADESQPRGADGTYPTTRYSYQGGTYPNGQWDFQYIINATAFTQAQVNALNSGITAELVALIGKGGGVLSVNGQTGEVTITPANIGAVNKNGDTMTGNLTVKNGNPAFYVQLTDDNWTYLGISADGKTRGIWDRKANAWLVNFDENNAPLLKGDKVAIVKSVSTDNNLVNEKSGLYENAFEQYSRYLVIGDGGDKFLMGWQYNSPSLIHTKVYNSGNLQVDGIIPYIEPNKLQPTTANGWTVGDKNLRIPSAGLYMVSVNNLPSVLMFVNTVTEAFMTNAAVLPYNGDGCIYIWNLSTPTSGSWAGTYSATGGQLSITSIAYKRIA